MRRRQMKKQKRIIIISSLCLLLCLCVGYAAFQTTLTLKAKGNIKEMPNCEMGGIKVNTVTDGDGLYKDIYEEERCVYRGQDPDNYIMFNDELWRIVAKEADGTYKIIRNEVLAKRAYDEANHRSTEKNSYCDSSIKIYLNEDYYTNNINSTAKEQMTSHSFNIGAVERLGQSGAEADSIEKNIVGEKMYQWTGNVGLANVSDILRASTNPLCTSATTACANPQVCNSNYLLSEDSSSELYYWTINAYSHESSSSSSDVWVVEGGAVTLQYARNEVAFALRPVVFLKSDTTLSGSGTQSDPFTIV